MCISMPTTEAKSVLHVAVGAIVTDDDRVLLSLRAKSSHQGGLWEFPGGKVEDGETVTEALVRELYEELEITATSYSPLIKVSHDYGDKAVLLDVWLVTAFSGTPSGREGQKIAWYKLSELGSVEFPKANAAIVNALQLQ